MKRWRLRVSIRALLFLVTLACAYAACWKPTQSKGPQDLFRELTANDPRFGGKIPYRPGGTDSVVGMKPMAPLLVSADRVENPIPLLVRREYYLWCFGILIQFRYQHAVKPSEGNGWVPLVP
jgi:hypothetical protein